MQQGNANEAAGQTSAWRGEPRVGEGPKHDTRACYALLLQILHTEHYLQEVASFASRGHVTIMTVMIMMSPLEVHIWEVGEVTCYNTLTSS